MSKVTTGLWQNVHDGKYIKVRSVNHTITSMVDCSDEGCAKVYGLLIEDLLSDYKLIESDAKRDRLSQVKQSSGISKTLARHGSLDEYVDSLPAYDGKPEVWKNINDDSCINVSRIGSKYAYWSEDGSSDSHSMDIKHFTENYRLAGIGSKPAPVVDDTFNDDTPAQTFGDIQWDMGTQDKIEAILVTVCPKCGSTVPVDSVEKPALRSWAARFLKAVKGIEVSE